MKEAVANATPPRRNALPTAASPMPRWSSAEPSPVAAEPVGVLLALTWMAVVRVLPQWRVIV